MFNKQLLSDYFQCLGVDNASTDIETSVVAGNKLTNTTPSERLKFIAEEIGLRCNGVGQASVDQAPPQAFPALAFIDLRWVLIRQDADGGYLAHCYETDMDLTLPPEKHALTVVLWLKIENEEVVKESAAPGNSVTTQKIITALIKKYPRWVVDVCVATLLVNLFAVITSLFAMQVYDRVVPTLAMSTLYSLVVGVFIIYALDFTLKNARSRILDNNASRIDKLLGAHVFSHLLKSELDKLPRQLGTLTAQLTSVESIRGFFTSSIVFTLIDLPFAIFFLFVMYLIGGPIAAVYLCFFVISLTIGFVAQKASQKANADLISRSNEKMGILVDTIKGSETIRSAAAEKSFSKEWNNVSEEVSTSTLAQKRINTLATTLSASLGQVSYAIAILVGVSQIGEGNMTMGAMIACSILGGRVLGPVGQAVGYLIQYESVRQSMSLVDSFLEVPKARGDDASLIFPTIKPSKFSLEALEFAYQGAKVPQVKIPTLEVNAGERIALLGGIGSGKSTLLKVLAGIIKPNSGRIRADGIDLWELDPYYVARNISYLPQSPDLFKGTLKNNLCLGNASSDTKIADVVKLLNLEPIYAQNDKGLDMEISEGGTGLSGGQRQMVGLARIFVNAPTIWLLDEPTASLDVTTQNTVVEAISKRLKPRDILIFATHNLKLARDLSSRIIVMDRGEIQKDVPTENVEVRRAAN